MGTIGDMTVKEFVEWFQTEKGQDWREKNRKGGKPLYAIEFDPLINIIFKIPPETLQHNHLGLDQSLIPTNMSQQCRKFDKKYGAIGIVGHKSPLLATATVSQVIREVVNLCTKNKDILQKNYDTVFQVQLITTNSTPMNLLPTTKKLTALLKQKGQIILKGPPGTGKTRLAQLVAGEIADPAQIQLIQFHPSYSYEDFIMGLEVGTEDGNIKYEMKSRGIKAFAYSAENSTEPFVLIIDEINRAPVSSVFGELMYALEYRGEKITLSSGQKMTLPKNLYIIGTMNTADRSIAELDYAMQRRFDFVEIPPTVPSDLQGKSFAEKLYTTIQSIFKRENIMIGIDPKDVQLGTSYFICNSDSSNNIDKDHLNYKINYEIIPLLTEYYKDGVFRKKQIMFEGETFQYYLQDNKQKLQEKLYALGGIQ